MHWALILYQYFVQYSRLTIKSSLQTPLFERCCLTIYLRVEQLETTVVLNEEYRDSECQLITIFAFICHGLCRKAFTYKPSKIQH